MSKKNEIKVGDKVFVHTGGAVDYYDIAVVERETATRWIVGGRGNQYRKKTLTRVGGNEWRQKRIIPIDEKSRAEYDKWFEKRNHEWLWRKIQDIARPRHLSAKRLQEIYDELKGQA